MSVDPQSVRIMWASISPAIRRAVERACTPRQLEVLQLHIAGHGVREVGRHLGVSHVAVQKTLAKAVENAREVTEPYRQR